MVRVQLNKNVDRNSAISEHHTPGPITRGVKERTSPDDRKEERRGACPEQEGSSSFGRFSLGC